MGERSRGMRRRPSERDLAISRAIVSANEALACLERASDQLVRASGWGVADAVAGGILVTLMKHRRLADARRELEAAQAAVRTFANQWDDVAGISEVNLNLGTFNTVFDFVFDNFLTDLVVQRQISEAQDQLEVVTQRVRDARDALCRLA